ncbi:DNA polymerase I [compost metagenome]
MAPVIKPKKQAVIKKGANMTYHAPTFKEHMLPNFYDTDKAEDVLKLIKPFEFMGRKFLVCDTEDYAIKMKNHDIPVTHVRRWIGTGRKAVPVDLPFCVSFCDGINSVTLYDSIENNYAEFRKLNCWFLDPEIEFIFHNAKFDMHMLANIKMKIIGKIHDTVVIAKLANENRHSFQLRDLAEKHPKGIVKFEYMVDNYKQSNKITDYRMIVRELLSQYANADVWNGYWVFMSEYAVLIRDELEGLYETELEDMFALYAMERHGMTSDPDYEEPLKKELRRIVDEAEQAVYDAVGYEFNMNSNAQIHKAMLHMGVDQSLFEFTDKGNICLDKKQLERLENLGVDLVVKIQEYRKNEKLLNTYAVGIYDQRDAEHKVHCSINQTEATTGRMSITKPALQTLPKKDKRVRRLFLPADGFTLWFMDLDQIEYRLLAHYAQAQGLIEAIKNGHDVHAATAAIIFNKDISEIDPDGEERQKAKTVNFSIVYGQGDEATSISLKMTLAEARRFKRTYFNSMPEIEPFIATVQRVTRTRGYVRNFYNRRRRLKSDEVYKAPNALIQGCAADYIKSKLILIYKFLRAHNYKTRVVNIVHDELLPEVHNTENHLVPKLRWLMSDFETFRVPITAGAEYGDPSWGQKVTPAEDVGFEPLTPEEMERTKNYNVFDGSVFDIAA